MKTTERQLDLACLEPMSTEHFGIKLRKLVAEASVTAADNRTAMGLLVVAIFLAAVLRQTSAASRTSLL